jgi:tyrosyl-tRNA synthetase
MSCGDDDIQKYLLLFTLLSPEEIQSIMDEHTQEPHLRK